MQNKITELKNQTKIPIVFIEHENNIKIGKLRNKANMMASGDILVCCDDDDYYPPERVEEAYEKLINSDLLIAGCSPTFMYDYILDKQYKFMNFWENHSPNNSFAYKKEYLTNHTHDKTGAGAYTGGSFSALISNQSGTCIVVGQEEAIFGTSAGSFGVSGTGLADSTFSVYVTEKMQIVLFGQWHTLYCNTLNNKFHKKKDYYFLNYSIYYCIEYYL